MSACGDANEAISNLRVEEAINLDEICPPCNPEKSRPRPLQTSSDDFRLARSSTINIGRPRCKADEGIPITDYSDTFLSHGT